MKKHVLLISIIFIIATIHLELIAQTKTLHLTLRTRDPILQPKLKLYDAGENQIVQLIPPYNMPSFIQGYCPEAFFIPAAKMTKKG